MMKDPVPTADGHRYDRRYVELWFKHNVTSLMDHQHWVILTTPVHLAVHKRTMSGRKGAIGKPGESTFCTNFHALNEAKRAGLVDRCCTTHTTL